MYDVKSTEQLLKIVYNKLFFVFPMNMTYILPITSHTIGIVARWPDKRYLWHVLISGHHDVALYECRRQWHGIDTKIDNYVIIARLKKSEQTCKLINWIPSSRLLISSLPGLTSRTHVEWQASRAIQQAFSKPCLVNLISKDTHLVFSI